MGAQGAEALTRQLIQDPGCQLLAASDTGQACVVGCWGHTLMSHSLAAFRVLLAC